MALSRVLRLRTAVSTSAGLASAAINFLACVEIAEYAGGQSAWLALVVAGILIVFSAANFAELTTLYPSSAALRVWTRRGMSNRISMMISLLYASTVIFVIAADAFVVGHAFQSAVPQIPGLLWVILLLAAMTWTNMRGIKIAGRVQDANALILLATLVAFSLVVIAHIPPAIPNLFHMGHHWFEAVAVGVFIYVGFEWVTPLAEEFSNPSAVRRGMFIALGLIAVAFGLFSVALTSVFPSSPGLVHNLSPQLVVGMRALGPFGYWWMVLVTLTTAISTFNGGLSTASRFLYALAREKVLPKWYTQLNGRFVPVNAVFFLSVTSLVLALIVYLTNGYMVLINAGAGVESLMYALSSWLVIRLRLREPDRARDFRVWGVPWVPAVAALIFVLLAIGALITPVSPQGIPLSLIFVLGLSASAVGYVLVIVPRLNSRR